MPKAGPPEIELVAQRTGHHRGWAGRIGAPFARTAFGLLILTPLALVVAGAAVLSRSTGDAAPPLLTMSIDADPTNGTRPCDPIDVTAAVPLNTTHTVAVCLSNYKVSYGSPQGFRVRVEYTLETAPEVPDIAPALADNPDANDGPGPTGLGASGWDCAVFGAYPEGNLSATPERDAFIFCDNAAHLIRR